MPDLENVSNGLCEVIGVIHGYVPKQYWGYGEQACRDAISMLKEQEAVKPTWNQGKAYCGKCGQRLPRKRADREINYCSYCGQEVKWDA